MPALTGSAAPSSSVGDLALVGAPVEVGGNPVNFHATRRSFATWLEEIFPTAGSTNV